MNREIQPAFFESLLGAELFIGDGLAVKGLNTLALLSPVIHEKVEPFTGHVEVEVMTEGLPCEHYSKPLKDVSTQPTPKVSRALIAQLAEADQDHEFYPTTNEIIAALVRDFSRVKNSYSRYGDRWHTVLDIGAGNGKVLMALKEKAEMTTLQAIEKSSILCRQLPNEILVVGTEFMEQSLLSKNVDMIFCNPPYTQFEEWTKKIIREANAHIVYFVIPQRWEKSILIADALKFRNVEIKKVGDFDFEDAEDRKARAKVHLLRIEFGSEAKEEGFACFFKEQFADVIKKFEDEEKANEAEKKKRAQNEADGATDHTKGGRHRPYHDLVVGESYPAALVSLYRGEIENIQKNYHLIGQLDVHLLREFEISPDKILSLLKTRLDGLKNEYWTELFDHLSAVTDRLTSASRRTILSTLHKHMGVDFTESNILEVIIWLIKNANQYIDSQLLVTYEKMVDKANVFLYKSNKRVWVDDRWRYSEEKPKNTHFALDYRIVSHRLGGIRRPGHYDSGLTDGGAEFFGDLLTIARNLGFNCTTNHPDLERHNRKNWESGKPKSFSCINVKNGKKMPEILFEARAFLNGNCHLRMNQDFMLALNVEHGRLQGWLKTGEQAAEELKDEKAAEYFKSNLQLGSSNPALLLSAPK